MKNRDILVFFGFIIMITFIINFDNVILGLNVKSRLYPEEKFEFAPGERSSISVEPPIVKVGGLLEVTIKSGKFGMIRSFLIYKVKPGPDIKVESKSLRNFVDMDGDWSCNDEKYCMPNKVYKFPYKLGLTDEFGEGLYYAMIYDRDSGQVIAFFVVEE